LHGMQEVRGSIPLSSTNACRVQGLRTIPRLTAMATAVFHQ